MLFSLKSTIRNFVFSIINDATSSYKNKHPENPTNIQSNLQMKALDSTVKYIEEKMVNVPNFDTHHKVLDYAISKAENPGLFCEFGVYRGTTINYIAKRIKTNIHGFDSFFEGLPEFWRDDYEKGSFALTELPSVCENVQLHVGWFEETLPIF